MNTLSPPFLPPEIGRAVRAAAGDDAYVVGGFVRDRLLGRVTADLDVAVAAAPRAVANRLRRLLGGNIFPLSTEHGVWRLTLPSPIDGIAGIDVVAMRGTIADDLAERDFTINAMAAPPEGEALIDPFGGLADLQAGVVRVVVPGAIAADPLRALRAVRHAAELGFVVDEDTAAIIRRDGALIRTTAYERQRDELMRVFDSDRAAAGVRLLDALGLLDRVLPELTPAKGCSQPKEHYWDVFEHSVETVAVLDCLLLREPAAGNRQTVAHPGPAGDQACGRRRQVLRQAWPEEVLDRRRWDGDVSVGRSRRALLKLIGLLHDVSKPETRSVQADGRVRFFGHAERGAAVAAAALQRLRFSAREVRITELLIAEHLRPGQLAAPGEEPTARALYRLYRDLGESVPDLLLLYLADGAAAAGPRQTAAQWRAHAAYTGWILRQAAEREALVRRQRLVTGHDLIAELGLTPGPAMGRILDALAEAEAAGEVTTREGALDRARALAEAGS
jgi:poly(A) polymerase